MGLIYDCKLGRGEAAALAVLCETREFMRLLNLESIRQQRWDRRQCRGFVFTTVTALLVVSTLVSTLTGCDVERRKSDAELGLTPQQVAGRKTYDQYCDRCHEPYSTRGKKGPGLKGVFQHQYLSLSGLPANDERVADMVNHGRNEMPGFSQALSAPDVQDLLAYMHTL
jgi:mono/diheme cytochrome c family protein